MLSSFRGGNLKAVRTEHVEAILFDSVFRQILYSLNNAS